MKRLMTILAVLVLVGAVAVPVMAWYPGWGRGHHMMGYWGNGPGSGRVYYGNLAIEQKNKLEALDRKYYEDTRTLRDKVWAKSRELDIVLNSSNPDLEKAKALENEIGELRVKLDEKALAYELEVRKIVPDRDAGYGNDGWYGNHRGYYGHMRGYGGGYCWN